VLTGQIDAENPDKNYNHWRKKAVLQIGNSAETCLKSNHEVSGRFPHC